jgi:pectate lyase
VESNVYAEANLVTHAREIYVVGEESSSDAKLTFTDTNQVVALSASAEALYQIEPDASAFDPSQFYTYGVDSADSLATLVPEYAGAGKI